MRMIGSLKSDFCKTVKSAGFLAAVIVTFLLCFTENVYVDRTTARSYSVFESLFELDRQIMYRDDGFCSLMIFKNSLTGYSAMFLPILASFPFAVSQSAGRNSGNIRFSIFRAKRMRYYFSKFICCVISGGSGVMLGVALFGIFSFVAFPGIGHYPDIDLSYYVPDGVFAEILKKLMSAFIYGCVSTLPAFLMSAFCRNLYIILCVPFLTRFVHETAIGKILSNATDREIYQKVFPFQCSTPSVIPYLGAGAQLFSALAVTIISAALALFGYIIIMERRTDKGD